MSRPWKIITVVLLAIGAAGNASANQQRASVLRQYPVQNAFEVTTVTNIGITASAAYDQSGLEESGLVIVRGSVSGLHAVTMHLSDDEQTLILHPVNPFKYNETVTVLLRMTVRGGASLVDSFEFRTMQKPVDSKQLLDQMTDANLLNPSGISQTGSLPPAEDTTVDSLPLMHVLIDRGSTPGTYYLSNFPVGDPVSQNFLLDLDEHGNIRKKKNLEGNQATDYKLQKNKEITYFSENDWKFLGVDSLWNVIDTFPAANGYKSDQHELLILPDGGYALLALSQTTLDSSQYVDSMVRTALVGGNVIQIFDAHGNETFEWRGIDHYRVADAVHEKLHASSIDFEHANALDFDADGNIIISNRHLSEVSKISRTTGAFMWRLGGAHNQFQLKNDSIWFSYQHAARILPNGHLTMFDNGNFDSVAGSCVYKSQSRAVEYELDTTNLIAKQVWQWHHTPETYSLAMGYVERLANQHTVIGWGLNYDYGITEIGPDGSTLFEMSLGPNNVSYRVMKDVGPDSLLSVASAPVRSSGLPCSFSTDGTTGMLNLTLDNAASVTVSVYDLLGRTVLPVTSEFESEGAHSIHLPIASLIGGSYFCEVRTSDSRAAMVPFAVVR